MLKSDNNTKVEGIGPVFPEKGRRQIREQHRANAFFFGVTTRWMLCVKRVDSGNLMQCLM